MSIRMRLREEHAQATVEMAVVTPVLLVLALIVYNVMIFASAVARFDRVVPDIVLAHAVASEGEGDESSVDASATVQTQILNAMEGYDLQIEVSSEQGAEASDGGLLSLSGTFRTYTCTMHYEPWPTSLSIAGVPLGAPTTLSHERTVTVDPWRPGGGHVTAVSSYIAYARALNRLGWTPAEFAVAESFVVRLRGMLGRRPVAANGLPLVMAFPRCSSVHTCFMAYPIDIAFIDRDGNILARYENVCPWRMCSCPGAWAALERSSIIVSTPALQRVPA